MNEFDQFIKNQLQIKRYVRYTDDFVIISENKNELQKIVAPVEDFLWSRLRLELHPQKVEIRKARQGIDFLGYIILPHHRRVRTKTKRRMIRKMRKKALQNTSGQLTDEKLQKTVDSYSGVLKHAHAHNLSDKMKNAALFFK